MTDPHRHDLTHDRDFGITLPDGTRLSARVWMPDDQQPDDARSACFDGSALAETTDIVGRSMVQLRLSAERPRAQLVVRLCDLRPDGTSMLITLGCWTCATGMGSTPSAT